MPIYEYQCKACEHLFDVLQKMSDDPLTYCPECGEPELRKLLSAPNFRLKGGGWYETDFKDKNKRNLAESADAASADSASKPDSKPDSKPASKSSDSSSSTE
jgi:putative FmdB family regulatory protein